MSDEPQRRALTEEYNPKFDCCLMCRFGWLLDDTLVCRRFPPCDETRQYGFPIVECTDWCGEFQPRKDAKPPTPNDTETPIDELGLPVRISNALESEGICTIELLCKRSKDQVFAVRNVGVNAIDMIVEKLSQRGLKLRVPGEK